ncbi:MAG: SH3 domain-containing protein [Pseudomonadota bacterium]
MSSRYRVVAEWKAAYEDPITLKASEVVLLDGETDNWEGHLWVWAQNSNGKEGWIPDTLIETVNGRHYAKEEFSAVELTCNEGEILFGLRETHGWILCRSRMGSEGWVPARNLEPE